MKKILLAVSVLTLILGLSVTTAQAKEVTAGMEVSANIVPEVTIQTASLQFGDLEPGENLAQTAIIIAATGGMPYMIAIDAGSSYNGLSRNMSDWGWGYSIPYYLYKDVAHSEEWGDADYASTYPLGNSNGPFIGIGSSEVHTVYGKAVSTLDQPGSGYYDYLTVTVQY